MAVTRASRRNLACSTGSDCSSLRRALWQMVLRKWRSRQELIIQVPPFAIVLKYIYRIRLSGFRGRWISVSGRYTTGYASGCFGYNTVLSLVVPRLAYGKFTEKFATHESTNLKPSQFLRSSSTTVNKEYTVNNLDQDGYELSSRLSCHIPTWLLFQTYYLFLTPNISKETVWS